MLVQAGSPTFQRLRIAHADVLVPLAPDTRGVALLERHKQSKVVQPADVLLAKIVELPSLFRGCAFAKLSAPESAALTMCFALGLSNTEAAEALDMPLGTLKSHVLRGREKLKAILGDQP